MKKILLENASKAFKNARETCPGMSKELYEVTDYISNVVKEDEISPQALLITICCVQDDIQKGRNGFNSNEDIPKYLIENKSEVISQIMYIPQIVDAITSKEFSQEFRNLCKESFGFVVPRKVNVDIEEKYPEYVKVAVDWWANAIQTPKLNNGLAMNPSFLMFAASMNKEYKEEDIMIFKENLSKSIQNQVQTTGRCKLSVDYSPCQILEEAGNLIGINDITSFPWKTTMYISENSVEVISYNSGEGKNLYSKEKNKSLKYNSENDK